MKHIAGFLLLLGIIAMTPSRVVASDDDTGAWAILSTSDAIYRNGQATAWRYAFDTQLRHFNRGNGSNQYVLRPAIGYVLNDNVSIWAGYGYFLNDPDGASGRDEHRWWQQAAWTAQRWDWGTLALRTRLEERVIENGDDTGVRLRQQARLAIPVGGGDLSLVLSIEPFFNFRDTDWGARSGLDQIRTYAGVRMPMTRDLSLEAGYMHQYINRHGMKNAVNHLGMLHLRVKF